MLNGPSESYPMTRRKLLSMVSLIQSNQLSMSPHIFISAVSPLQDSVIQNFIPTIAMRSYSYKKPRIFIDSNWDLEPTNTSRLQFHSQCSLKPSIRKPTSANSNFILRSLDYLQAKISANFNNKNSNSKKWNRIY